MFHVTYSRNNLAKIFFYNLAQKTMVVCVGRAIFFTCDVILSYRFGVGV